MLKVVGVGCVMRFSLAKAEALFGPCKSGGGTFAAAGQRIERMRHGSIGQGQSGIGIVLSGQPLLEGERNPELAQLMAAIRIGWGRVV